MVRIALPISCFCSWRLGHCWVGCRLRLAKGQRPRVPIACKQKSGFLIWFSNLQCSTHCPSLLPHSSSNYFFDTCPITSRSFYVLRSSVCRLCGCWMLHSDFYDPCVANDRLRFIDHDTAATTDCTVNTSPFVSLVEFGIGLLYKAKKTKTKQNQ